MSDFNEIDFDELNLLYIKFTDFTKFLFSGTGGIRTTDCICYSFVWHPEKPTLKPWEYEECVYIGESAGFYNDKHGKKMTNFRRRGFPYKRMMDHQTILKDGEARYTKQSSSAISNICEVYKIGKKYGRDFDKVLNGEYTGAPMWLAIIARPPDLPEYMYKSFSKKVESDYLYYYAERWGHTPLGNKDRDVIHKDPNSYSSKYGDNGADLESFF